MSLQCHISYYTVAFSTGFSEAINSEPILFYQKTQKMHAKPSGILATKVMIDPFNKWSFNRADAHEGKTQCLTSTRRATSATSNYLASR